MQGQIIREYGQTLEVDSQSRIYSCFPRKNIPSLVVGDWVEFDWDPITQQGVITNRLSRKSFLARRDRYHPLKEMAANIDQVVVMIAPIPEPNEYYLDQYLVAAELNKLNVFILFNKADLLDTAETEIEKNYKSIGYSVLRISAKTGLGLEVLQTHLTGKLSFLLGVSGVGKSSLINMLIQDAKASVQEISTANQKGQHTTSVSTLYRLSQDTAIIDVPGIRELQLPAALQTHLPAGFREFQPWLGQCRFRNCSHQGDPGCILVGKASPQRLKNYYRMCQG